ncbi:hypothetical protein SPHG1_17 [Salmonella phage SPHG1]|nr:hypothetical protein SPHG1_17 [Salmonella phage SPHG1]
MLLKLNQSQVTSRHQKIKHLVVSVATFSKRAFSRFTVADNHHVLTAMNIHPVLHFDRVATTLQEFKHYLLLIPSLFNSHTVISTQVNGTVFGG